MKEFSPRQPARNIDDFIDEVDKCETTRLDPHANITFARSIEEEVQAYMSHKLSSDEIKMPALLWWSKFGALYPRMLRLALRVLAVQPTSAESERSFSSSGLISSKRRASLHSRTLHYLFFSSLQRGIKTNREIRLAKRSRKAKTITSESLNLSSHPAGMPNGGDSDWSTDDENS